MTPQNLILTVKAQHWCSSLKFDNPVHNLIQHGFLDVANTQIAVQEKRSKRPSLPEVRGTADDVMDEEEFRPVICVGLHRSSYVVHVSELSYPLEYRHHPSSPMSFPFHDSGRLVTREREAKKSYKEAFDALVKAKAKMEASARQEEGLRRELLSSFEAYCESKVKNRARDHHEREKLFCAS